MHDREQQYNQYLLTIEMWVFVVGDEKLAAIGIGPTVCHGHYATLSVLECIIYFIWELAIRSRKDAFATFASPCGITALCCRPFVSETQQNLVLHARSQDWQARIVRIMSGSTRHAGDAGEVPQST